MLENLEISWLVFRVASSCKGPRENHDKNGLMHALEEISHQTKTP